MVPAASCLVAAEMADPAALADTDMEAAAESQQLPGDSIAAECRAAVEEELKQWGGPQRYLQHNLGEVAQREAFLAWLLETFPEKDSAVYCYDSNLPATKHSELAQALPIALHVSSFSYHTEAAVKPAPGRDLTLQLVDHYLADGFITSGEVLLVSQPTALKQAGERLPPFTVGYVKGQARMLSLLGLLFVMHEKRITMEILAKDLPKFHDSVCLIWAQRVDEGSRTEEALLNMKLSLRGSLRKACNVVQICEMIRRLRSDGETFAKFIQRWNSSSARAYQLAGRKSQSLKLLFENTSEARGFLTIIIIFKLILQQLAQDTLDLILDHVNTLGWDHCVYSEDNLASKRIYVGYQFPAKSKRWQQRLKVTELSMLTMTSRVQFLQETAADYCRRKLDVQTCSREGSGTDLHDQ